GAGGVILNLMVKYSDDQLDEIFAALSDRTRRRVLASLEDGSRPVTELASTHDMSLPGFMKHLRVLEDAGLLERTKEGRVVRCTLQPQPMKEAASWIAQYEKFWTDKLDSLARYLYQQEELQTWKKLASPTSLPHAHARVRSAARKDLAGVDRRESAEAVVVPSGRVGVRGRARCPRRRPLPDLLRRRGRQRARVRRHLQGGGEVRQARLHLDLAAHHAGARIARHDPLQRQGRPL